jgi:hypothetical protein
MSSSGCDREKEADCGEADCLAAGPVRLGPIVERGIRAGCPLGTGLLLGRLSCGECFGRAWWEVAVEAIAGDARLGDDLGDGVLHEAIDTLAGLRTPYWLGASHSSLGSKDKRDVWAGVPAHFADQAKRSKIGFSEGKLPGLAVDTPERPHGNPVRAPVGD